MRDTIANTRSLYMTVLSDVARVTAHRQSIVSSQSALDATTAGYEVGTRNVVDVLNAQNALFSARRDYANVRYDYVNNMLRLKQQAGLLSPEDVHRLDADMVPPSPPTATEQGSGPGPGTGPGLGPLPDSGLDPEPEPEPDSDSGAGLGPLPDSGLDPEPEPEPDSESEPESGAPPDSP